MARRRVVEDDRGDEPVQQLTWARYIARFADLGGLTEPRSFDNPYMEMSADELRALAARHPDHPASRQIEKHLALAAEARVLSRRGGLSGI